MHPTIDEQLAGVRRLLDQVETDTDLSGDSRESLANARRLVAQVARSWSALPGFYRDDNAALAALLTRWSPYVGPGLAAEIAALVSQTEPADDVTHAAPRNATLRGLLSRVIGTLASTEHAATARVEIGKYLSTRIHDDPS